MSIYDRRFHIEHGYCQKLRRDDRRHALGLNVQAEVNDLAHVISSSLRSHSSLSFKVTGVSFVKM